MPVAALATTGPTWATERAIDLWCAFANDVENGTCIDIACAFDIVRQDGADTAIVAAPNGDGIWSGTRTVPGPASPSPYGLLHALQAADVFDVRRMGVIARSPASILAAHRAGAGAIVALVDGETSAAVLEASPDIAISRDEFATAYRERYASDRPLRNAVLLNPGPSLVSDRVHRAIAGPDICHREPEYTWLARRVEQKLRRVANVADDWGVVLLAGSGTAGMEAAVGSMIRPGRSIVVCRNGIYGDRLLGIASRLGIATVVVDGDPTEPIDPAAVSAAFDSRPDIDAVAVVHHETTTGLLNPVAAIAREARSRGILVITDAISSFGAEELALTDPVLDVVITSSNKCLHGLPGLAILFVSPAARMRAFDTDPRSLYFDVAGYLRAGAGGSVPFTPPIPAVYALDAALDELIEEGTDRRRERYRSRMAYLDSALSRLGLEARVAPAHRSSSVRSLPLPAGVDYRTLHDRLKARGYVIYAGLGDAADSTFRICAMGNVTVPALGGLISEIRDAAPGISEDTDTRDLEEEAYEPALD